MTEEQLKQLAALLGVDAGELTAETAFDKLTEWDKGRREADAKREEEIGSLKKQVEALKAANPNSEPQLDADTADMLAEGVESGLEQLVTASKLTPAARDKLQPLLVGQPGQPAVRMLSRAATGGAKSVARQIIEALQGNDPVELGEQSRSQAVRLSRQVPDDQGPEYDPEITKEMAAMAGVPSADS